MLDQLRTRLPAGFLTRFAPSPTGLLHLGHVVNAAWVWGAAQALGGRVLLRLEDHDRTRCRPEFERALLDDLDWLGLEPDIAPTAEFRRGSSDCRQSDAGAHYETALAVLRAAGRAYVCSCSRKEIAQEMPDRFNEEMRYPGTCRTRGLGPGEGLGWRVKLYHGDERFDDARLGPQLQTPAEQCGDFLIRDRLGHWTYQFAVTVDDMRHGIDLVIRGEDLLASAGRQIALARLLGRPDPPAFLHHPLILKPSGEKLSKASGDTGIAELRAAGVKPAWLLGAAAHLGGLLPDARPVAAADLGEIFGAAATR
jgi:glutamyl-tRNA synthetase/glutamyl-Q tRNA(Asp) synthetase